MPFFSFPVVFLIYSNPFSQSLANTFPHVMWRRFLRDDTDANKSPSCPCSSPQLLGAAGLCCFEHGWGKAELHRERQLTIELTADRLSVSIDSYIPNIHILLCAFVKRAESTTDRKWNTNQQADWTETGRFNWLFLRRLDLSLNY